MGRSWRITQGLFVFGVAALALPAGAVTCSVGQAPWSATHAAGSGGTAFGWSPWEACSKVAVIVRGAGALSFTNGTSSCVAATSIGGNLNNNGSVTEECQINSTSSGSGGTSGTVTVSVAIPTVTVAATPYEPTAQDVADYSMVWGAMTAVVITLFFLRKILNIFDGKYDGS